MSRRITLFESMGEDDKDINNILYDESEGNNSADTRRLKRIMLKIINNELTARQKEIIMLYYFNNRNIIEIADMLGVTPASVSITLKRARNRLLKHIKYYFL